MLREEGKYRGDLSSSNDNDSGRSVADIRLDTFFKVLPIWLHRWR